MQAGSPVGRWAAREQPHQRERHWRLSLMRRLEKLDWISVGIQNLDLPACRRGFDGVAKHDSGAAQSSDDCRQVTHLKNDAIGAAGPLLFAAWQGPRSGGPRPAEMDL